MTDVSCQICGSAFDVEDAGDGLVIYPAGRPVMQADRVNILVCIQCAATIHTAYEVFLEAQS